MDVLDSCCCMPGDAHLLFPQTGAGQKAQELLQAYMPPGVRSFLPIKNLSLENSPSAAMVVSAWISEDGYSQGNFSSRIAALISGHSREA